MAIATAYLPVNITVFISLGDDVTGNIASSHCWVAQADGAPRFDFYGAAYTAGPDYTLTGGTTHRITFRDGSGTLAWEVTGLNHNAVTGQQYALAGDVAAMMAWGFSGNDEINGSAQADVIGSYAGNDTVYGNGGDDSLDGGGGSDTLRGGGGSDTLRGAGGGDLIDGGAGTDTAVYSSRLADYSIFPNWFVLGEVNIEPRVDDPTPAPDGYDLLKNVEKLRFSDVTVSLSFGTSSTDDLAGGSGRDMLFGGGGMHDEIQGGGGDDTLYGGTGDDVFTGGAGADRVVINADYAIGAPDGDLYQGAAGEWFVVGQDGLDTLYGVETVQFLDRLIRLGSDDGEVIVGTSGNDVIFGAGGDDTITALDGDDEVDAGDGDDLIVGGSGNGDDRYSGGAGTDSLRYSSATNAVNANLDTGRGSGTDIGNDTLDGVENLIGGKGADKLTGDTGANELSGLSGNDTLKGGAGHDQLTGGTGADKLVFAEAPLAANSDVIVGFVSGSDKIQVDDVAFAALRTLGPLSGTHFTKYFDYAGGKLYYDADGPTGSTAPVLIAALQGAPALAAADIVVI